MKDEVNILKNPNVRIVVIALALVAAVALAALLVKPGGEIVPPDAQGEGRELPKAYLRVQVGSEVLPLLPLTDGGEYEVDQGNGRVNVIHTTATGAVMHSSTCDNQSCVQQGEVTLENRDTRVLTNMIICLPNQVILEILTPAEAGMEAVQ